MGVNICCGSRNFGIQIFFLGQQYYGFNELYGQNQNITFETFCLKTSFYHVKECCQAQFQFLQPPTHPPATQKSKDSSLSQALRQSQTILGLLRWKTTSIFLKWKTTSFFPKMEDHLNFYKWKKTKFLSTRGTSTEAPVCLSVFRFLTIDSVII